MKWKPLFVGMVIGGVTMFFVLYGLMWVLWGCRG
jgi:hypothetical protein